jgi:hypothetical protein
MRLGTWNRMLRNIFGPKRDDITAEWRRLHKEELYDPCSSPNIIWMIRSRRMRWEGHVTRVAGGGGEKVYIRIWLRDLREVDHF